MSRRGDVARNAQKIVDRITHLHPLPLTMRELLRETGLTRAQIQRAFVALRDPDALRVRIAGWERRLGGGDLAPRYGLADGKPDARKIRKMTKQEYEQRRRDKTGAVTNALRRLRRTGAVAGPFDGLMGKR